MGVANLLTAFLYFIYPITSLCICGVSTIQGRQVGSGKTPGQITKALMDAYVDFVDYDWIGQYLRHLD